MLYGGSGGSAEVADCVKPALESIHETRIKRQVRHLIISFRIQIGLNPSYAYAGAEVKKLKE
jgi:hypothetical protein